MVSITDLVRGMKDARWATIPVVLMAVIGSGIYVFLELADEISENEIRAVDRALFLLFRETADIEDPLGPPWFEEAVAEITALGGYPILVIVVLAVIGFLIVVGKRGPALYVALSVGLGTVVGQALKMLYDRPRPDIVEHLVSINTASFPSGHATMSTIVYLTLASLIVRLVDQVSARVYVLVVAVLLALAIGLSRIYLGVHWPSDVAAGWAIGVVWASLSWLIVGALRFRRASRHDAIAGQGREAAAAAPDARGRETAAR